MRLGMPPAAAVLVACAALGGAGGALLDFKPCPGFFAGDAADRGLLRSLVADADTVSPGGAFCLGFRAVPARASGAWSVRVIGLLDEVAFSLCGPSSGELCPAANRSLRGRICAHVPIEAIMLTGEALNATLWFQDERGATAACYQTKGLRIGDRLVVDESKEDELAAVRAPLRRVLSQGWHGGDGEAAAEAETEVASLLEAAYARQPEWATTFARWRAAHGRTEPYTSKWEEARWAYTPTALLAAAHVPPTHTRVDSQDGTLVAVCSPLQLPPARWRRLWPGPVCCEPVRRVEHPVGHVLDVLLLDAAERHLGAQGHP